MNYSNKILVVDDDTPSRKMLGDMLKNDNTVIMADGFDQTIEKALSLLPDLILLDLTMPGMDGFAVLRRLKADARTSAIAVIFITGTSAPEAESHGMMMGASDYITKPFSAAVVQARVALHLRLAHQQRMLETLANIDGLTGIPNRRQFELATSDEIRRCGRNGLMTSVALLDVDFLSQYNELYGHAMGDHALCKVSGVLSASIGRSGDMIARHGGGKFALLMPETPPAGALSLAVAVRIGVEALGIPHAKSSASISLTVSIGVATTGGARTLGLDDLMKLADEHMLRAKTTGRNRVVGG